MLESKFIIYQCLQVWLVCHMFFSFSSLAVYLTSSILFLSFFKFSSNFLGGLKSDTIMR